MLFFIMYNMLYILTYIYIIYIGPIHIDASVVLTLDVIVFLLYLNCSSGRNLADVFKKINRCILI